MTSQKQEDIKITSSNDVNRGLLTFMKKKQEKKDKYEHKAGYRNIIETISILPPDLRNMTFNYLQPNQLYAHILMDNPKVNLTRTFYQYLEYMKSNIDIIKTKTNSNQIITAFGLDVKKNWDSLDYRSHLVDISYDVGLFLEYACWDCPFIVLMLAAIQNSDGETLEKLINFYECIDADCAFHIFESLVKYAFDFRRMTMITNIVNAFSSLFVTNQQFEKVNNSLSKLMTYFVENYNSCNFNNMVNEPVNFVKLIELLENQFPNLYKYYQINWTGYVYYLVKNDDVANLMKMANVLEEPYMALDYEVVIYALEKKKDGCLAVLMNGFKWNDRRDDAEKARLSDLNKSDLEKIVYYLLQNIDNQQSNIEKGFDPSFLGCRRKFANQSHFGIQEIYNTPEKRFHMNIYLKAMSARQFIMMKWCQDNNENPSILAQSIFNDIEERSAFNESVMKFMVHKLNKALKSIDKYHDAHGNLPVLVCQYSNVGNMMFRQIQFDDPDVVVV